MTLKRGIVAGYNRLMMTWTGSECQEIMSNLNLDLVLTIQPTQRVDTTFIWKVCLPMCKDTLLK